MAGTMPHAIFVETGLDGGSTVAAYAAELPGCAVFASTDADAVGAMPRRVAGFTAWLRSTGEAAPDFIGDNWYEVERGAVRGTAKAPDRVMFSLDELPPSAGEFDSYLRWLELAREELAAALDAAGGAPTKAINAIVRQDLASAALLGSPAPGAAPSDPIDRLYVARDHLTDALDQAGPGADGVRRIVRVAIADDLRLAERLRESSNRA
jgi:hypothetical protein